MSAPHGKFPGPSCCKCRGARCCRRCVSRRRRLQPREPRRPRACGYPRAVPTRSTSAATDDTFDRVQVDRRTPRDRINAGVENHFARESTNRRRTRRDDRAPKPRDGCVSGQDDDGAAADVGELAPPHLAARWKRAHESPAARRQEARSPHSSGSSGRVFVVSRIACVDLGGSMPGEQRPQRLVDECGVGRSRPDTARIT